MTSQRNKSNVQSQTHESVCIAVNKPCDVVAPYIAQVKSILIVIEDLTGTDLERKRWKSVTLI